MDIQASPSTPPPELTGELHAELDRRFAERREEDRTRHRTVIALAGALITATVILVSVGVAWGTATAAMAQKVDKIEQLKVDAGFDARLNVHDGKIDGVYGALARLQSSVDSANVRLRQMACDGKSPSCR